jgi:lipopolysaccharide export system permease protein
MGTLLLALHGGVLLLALGLLWWRDHATVFTLRARRAPAAVATARP